MIILTSVPRLTLTPGLQVEDRIPIIHGMVFPNDWLDAKAEDDPQGRTNREVQTEVHMMPVDSCVMLILYVYTRCIANV